MSYDLQISGDLIVEIIIILILWALTVMNTELLINWNHFEPSDDPESIWQFGQVRPCAGPLSPWQMDLLTSIY